MLSVKLSKSFTETHKMMRNAYDDPRSGRPSTSTDGVHVTIVRSNRRLSVRGRS